MNANLQKPLVYLITKGEITDQNYARRKTEILEIVRRAVSFNVSLIQIREKKLCAKFLYELARETVEITKNSPTKLLINDRADIALAAGADGVHLTENSLSAKIIRQNFPKDFIIGVSAHTLEDAKRAQTEAADFAVFSPIFETPDKDKLKGINQLSEVCEKLNPFPILALGGINETNYQSVLSAGASGFAAIRFLNDEENLRKLKLK